MFLSKFIYKLFTTFLQVTIYLCVFLMPMRASDVIYASGSVAKPGDLETAIALNNMGALLVRQGQYASAEGSLRKAYAVLEKTDAANSVNAASVLSNLALSIHKQGCYKEAEPLYELAETLVKRWDGESSIEYAKVLTNSALLAYEMGNYASAVKQIQKAVDV
ncbi:MAG: tetratricopeptide repeat protein, partial [Acidobacteriaceae bacterium]|nr:tetratricopeptide repeat protein [Acidobacteriaceae bacterium]